MLQRDVVVARIVQVTGLWQLHMMQWADAACMAGWS